MAHDRDHRPGPQGERRRLTEDRLDQALLEFVAPEDGASCEDVDAGAFLERLASPVKERRPPE